VLRWTVLFQVQYDWFGRKNPGDKRDNQDGSTPDEPLTQLIQVFEQSR
jgi:hypothetical protein